MTEDTETQSSKITLKVLRLRGLPFQATEQDIKDFFTGYELVQVLICRRAGRATGEAFVQFAEEGMATRALSELDKKHIGRRYIELFEATESDMTSVKALCGDSKTRGFVLRLRGLPYNATPQDILRFFSNVVVARGVDGVVITYTPEGRPTGEAYVEFLTEDAQREAMKKHKELLGSRYIEIFMSTKADFYQAIQQNKYNMGQAGLARRRWMAQLVASPLPGSSLDAASQRLLAPSAGVHDMTEFLKGFSLTGSRGLQAGPSQAGAAHLAGSYMPMEAADDLRGRKRNGGLGGALMHSKPPALRGTSGVSGDLYSHQQQLLMHQQMFLHHQQQMMQNPQMRYEGGLWPGPMNPLVPVAVPSAAQPNTTSWYGFTPTGGSGMSWTGNPFGSTPVGGAYTGGPPAGAYGDFSMQEGAPWSPGHPTGRGPNEVAQPETF